jgi:hypothetical protein
MKKSFILLQASIVILMLTFSLKASAQAPAPFSGPTTPGAYTPGTTVADGFVCLAGTIKLTGQGAVGNTYRWYKKSPSGTITLVQGPGAPNAATYTEASTTSGYYTYYVDQINPNGCISPMSNPINIYVLPAIAPVINGGQNYCANALPPPANLNLTIGGLDPLYTYTYQWTEDGADISGATANNYTVNNTTAATHAYTVKVSYNVSPSLTTPCPYTSPAKSIIVYPVPVKPTIQVN